MKKIFLLFLLVLLTGCTFENVTPGGNVTGPNNIQSSLNKDDYGTVYKEVADVLYTYNVNEQKDVRRKMDQVETSDDLLSVAIMIKMFSEVYLSDKFEGDPTKTITVKGVYEDAEMIFDVLSKYEDGYIYGSIRSYSEVFAPNESFNFIKVEYDFENNKIISFDSYSDYCDDGIEYSRYEDGVITRLDLETIDEEYNTIYNYIQTTKTAFVRDIQTSVKLSSDFSEEISRVIEYSPL